MDASNREALIELAEHDPEAIVDLVLTLSAGLDQANANIEMLKEENERLKQEIADLKRNSRNSSKPPSSDRNNKPPRSQRERGKRRPGGQAGHQGHHLEASENP